ncbi:cytochrome c biogenesis protein ResB [Aquincola sp. MAHUQ-54]|uniref:Cytochrome c biogenesis protein ResB n=1 Tax=Aquincola agrisoli TaxID=3119538 RepID=A0AAW9Q5Y0_9BURK
MTLPTTGLEVSSRSRAWRDAVELVSSMRFAISLLTVICIASVIGTVVQQHQPQNNYVNQFGPFWAEVFDAVGLYAVYSAWWFLLILAFLVVSTSLCIARNLPKITADLKAYKEHLREQSLNAFHHKAQGTLDEGRDAAYARIGQLLTSAGWKAKVQLRPHGTMIAARKGMANKLGYLAAHASIVLICLGGLFDGDLVVRAQMAALGKTPFMGGGMLRDVPPEHRLSANNPTFRANLLVPENARAGTAVISMSSGVVLQDLPFDIELKKFIVDYYDTGMPKLFASEIVIHDRDTGEARAATVKVNEPAFHRGVAIYQSSFDDGGSKLKLHAMPLTPGGTAFDVEGRVGDSTTLASADQQLTLEFAGLRVINVENLGAATAGGATDVRKVDLVNTLQDHLGSGAKVKTTKTLQNVGPSVSYRLRDAAGQAREFNNYMRPVDIDGQRVLLAGVRENPNENFRYLRIPVDEEDSIEGWMRLRRALVDPALRSEAARRYVAKATPADKPEMAEQLAVTTQRVLGLFAGAESPGAGKDDAPQPAGGLMALSRFLETTVPEAERPRISEVLLRILNGALFELLNTARERDGLKAAEPGDTAQAFMSLAVLSLSDSFLYPAPVILQLATFEQIQASVFQVARAPGKTLVYIGAVLLIIGVFAMLYVRERRLWVWLQDEGDGRTRISTALSTTRRTLDADAEFDRLKHAILKEAP